MSSELPVFSSWPWGTLDSIKATGRSIVSGPFGSNIGKRFFLDRGVPVIRGNNLSLGMNRFNDCGFVYLADEKAAEFKNCEAYPNDLIFTAAGTIGQVGLIPEAPKYKKYIISNKQLRARLDTDKVFPLFAYYWFASPPMMEMIQNRNTGTTIPLINLSVLRSLPIPLPPLAIQQDIANLLDTLDARISLLRTANATLEAIAQALFKSWFVDFDPVRAKQEGRLPEGMDDATAALFPETFEESKLGLIPSGWAARSIEEMCIQVTNGGTPSRSKPDFWEGGITPWFKTGEFKDGFLLEPSERITQAGVKGSSVKILPKDAVLMAIYAAPTVGRLGILAEPATFNQACTGMVAKEHIGMPFLYLTLFFGRAWFNNRANGAAQQNISKAIVATYLSVVPDQRILSVFNDHVAALFAKILVGSQHAQTLSAIRDTLLPRLISGQLRLSGINQFSEEMTAT